MKKSFYFTFGQQYTGVEHPTYPKAHRDGWVTIVADDERLAREKAFELFGAHFATSYSEEYWNPRYFPKGEIERIEI